MKHHDVKQGSKEWKALRADYDCASDASAMMGDSKYKSRDDLLNQKVTGEEQEVTPEKQALFDRGHEAEAAIRPVLEELIGEDLYPVVGTEGELLASFDGLTMDETILAEHKLYSKSLAEQIGRLDLAPHYYWQLEQQLLISGAERALFVASDGTETNMDYMWYVSQPERRERLIVGWAQFKVDLENFAPVEKIAEKVGTGPKALPVLNVQVFGEITTETNLVEFKARSVEMINGIKDKLETDQDFKDADVTAKFLKQAEEKLELTKEQALSKTASLNELFTTLDEVKGLMKQARLRLDKQVAADKKNRRLELVDKGQGRIVEHMLKTNEEFEPRKILVSLVAPDLWQSIRGMSSFDNMAAAISDDVARFKVEVNQRAAHIRNSLSILDDKAADYPFLLTDLQTLVEMEPDYLELLIDKRIADYKEEAQAQEQAKIAARRAVIDNFKAAEAAVLFGDEDVTLAKLEYTKSTLAAISTDDLGDDKEEADTAKENALIALTNAIFKKNAQLDEEERLAQVEGAKEETDVDLEVVDDNTTARTGVPHDDALPGHDDLEEQPTYKVTVTPKDMFDAIKTVLDGGFGTLGLDWFIDNQAPPTGEALQRWSETLRKVI